MELRRPLTFAVRLSLRTCPFCGISPEAVAELRRFEGMQTRTLHQVICHCGAAGPTRATSADAAAAWDGTTAGAPEPHAPREIHEATTAVPAAGPRAAAVPAFF